MIDVTLLPPYTPYALGAAFVLACLLTYVRSRRQQGQEPSAV